MISSRKIDVIPIEVVYTGQTIKELAKFQAHSSVLRVLAPPYVKNARFIVGQTAAQFANHAGSPAA